MTVLLIGAGLLVASFLVQLVLWRSALPGSQTRALLVIFTLVPVCAAAAGFAAQRLPLLSAPELVRLALLYVSCMLAYIVLYSAIEMESPTLAIVSHLARHGTTGSSNAELFARFGSDDTLRSRIAAIEHGGWIHRDGERLVLTPSGRFYAGLFERGSSIVGLGFGKGG